MSEKKNIFLLDEIKYRTMLNRLKMYRYVNTRKGEIFCQECDEGFFNRQMYYHHIGHEPEICEWNKNQLIKRIYNEIYKEKDDRYNEYTKPPHSSYNAKKLNK